MASRHLTVFALLGTSLLAGVALQAADTPPTHLKLVNGHWTAWDPPTPPEGAKVHIVVPGDTFWDLAATNLNNPYLWPQIWEKNQYVRDAHWIYPGDPLVLDLQVAPASTVGANETGEEPTEEVSSAAGEGMAAEVEVAAADEGGARSGAASIPGVAALGRGSVPVPLGTQDDIYCSGFIGAPDEAFGYSVTGSEYEVLSPQLKNPVYGKVEGLYGTVDTVKYQLTTGDIVYIDGGRAAGLSPGMQFTAVASGNVVRHPVSNEPLGRQYNYTGRIRVLSVQEESAIAEIVQSCDGISVGMKLKPFEPEPIPLARRGLVRPATEPTSAEALSSAAVIVSSPVDLVTLGQDHVVFIDRGEDDEVLPGDIFTIYRMNRAKQPPVVLGELAVLSVQAHTAVAKILESRYPVYIGDRLERK
ncbi:MAG: LysM peptidoglycan-binding domain-containing protein [Thermoanaerobaculia bacterium]